MAKKRKVVVLTRYWPTALSVIRSLGAAAYDVDLVASVPAEGESGIAAASKYVGCSAETVCKSVKRGDDPGLLSELIKYRSAESPAQEEKPVLFATDDYTASFADRHRDVLESIFMMSYVRGDSGQTLTGLMNKCVQSSLARAAGLLCPQEWQIDLSGALSVPEDMVYPCFCKPLESIGGFKGEMARCDDHSSLVAHLEFLKGRNPNRKILVQEFLKIENEIDLQGVCTEEDVIIPAIIRKSSVADHEKGVTVAGRLAPFAEMGELQEHIKEMLRTSGYVGIFDMEFNIVGEKVYFGELNLRSGGPNYAYFLGGVNLPDLAVKAITGEVISDEEKSISEYGKHFVYEKILWKEYLEGYMSRSEFSRIMKEADYYLIGSSDDNAPTELFRREIRDQQMKKRRKKLRRYAARLAKPLVKGSEAVVNGYPQIRPSNIRKRGGNPRVMVVGRNYSSNLCMARSLGLAGYDVEIFRIMSGKPGKGDILSTMIPDAYSKYVKAYHTELQKKGSRRIAKALTAAAGRKDKMLLIPTEDVAAYMVDEHLNELRKYYHVPDAKGVQGEIIRLMSKDVQKKLAVSAGLPVLWGELIGIRSGGYTLPDGIVYPCFIKPDVSRHTSKSRMKKCADEQELRDALDEIAGSRDLDVLVEEYAEIERELSLLGLCYEGEVICPGLFEAVSGGHGSRRGVAATGRSIPVTDAGALLAGTADLLKKTGYNGLFDVDLIETTDGRMVFVELNLRYGASGYVLTRSGANLPGMLADRIMRDKPLKTDIEVDRTGVVFVSEKVLIEEYADGAVTEDEIRTITDSAEVSFIRDDDDPRPYEYFRKVFRRLR